MNQFPTKHPTEVFAVEIDFAKLFGAATVTSASVAASVYLGQDAAPGNILYGTVQIAGTKVTHRVQNGVAGTTYLLVFTATDGENIWVHEHLLPVGVQR